MSILKDESSGHDLASEYPVFYSIPEIEALFHKVAPFYPTLVIQWCNILTLLNYDNRKFWLKIVQPFQEPEEEEDIAISM